MPQDTRRAEPAPAPDGVEQLLLGDERATLTRREVASRAGVDIELSDRLWNAMGFPSTADSDRAFGPADVEALEGIAAIVASGAVEEATAIAVARAAGAALGELAETLATIVGRLADGRADVAQIPALQPAVERLIVYVLRRHLVAALLRARPERAGSRTRTLAVGFADLVGFTRLTRGVDEHALLELVERFDAGARERVARLGGRVIKTIGDEILFVADDVRAGARIAAALLELGGRDGLPEARAGMAFGELLPRAGDVFGEPVNIAARLVDLARPGTILIDRHAADALEGDAQWTLRALRPVAVRGYSRLSAHVLRRGDEP